MLKPSFALTALSLALLSAVSHGLDLSEALSKAKANDAAWQATQHSLEADALELSAGRGGLLPSIALSGSISQNKVDSSASNSAYNYKNTQWGAKATQPLFAPLAWFNYQRSRASYDISQANLRAQEQEFLLRVANGYFGLLRAQETLIYTQSEEAAYERQMDQAQKRYDVGLIAITDVLEAKAAFDTARANRISSEVALNDAQETLAIIIGEAPAKLVPLKTQTPIEKPQPGDPEAWAQKALSNNPAILIAEQSQEAAHAGFRQLQSTFLPTVNAFASYGSVDRTSTDSAAATTIAQSGTTTSYGLEATWQLFSVSNYASAKQASYRATAAKDSLSATKKTIAGGARTAFLNVNASAARIEAGSQAVASSESSLDAVKAGYDVGTRNIVDVLLAQRNMYAAKRNYASARYDYVINSLKLKAVTGDLHEVDIQNLNSWLDPNGSIVSAPDKPEKTINKK